MKKNNQKRLKMKIENEISKRKFKIEIENQILFSFCNYIISLLNEFCPVKSFRFAKSFTVVRKLRFLTKQEKSFFQERKSKLKIKIYIRESTLSPRIFSPHPSMRGSHETKTATTRKISFSLFALNETFSFLTSSLYQKFSKSQ